MPTSIVVRLYFNNEFNLKFHFTFKKMSKLKNSSPTNSELEILEILWENKNCTVREIYNIVSKKKECVYTTTLKIMQKMHSKGLIGRAEDNLKHEYFPLVEQTAVRNSVVNEILNKFFKGSYSMLALHALGKSSKDENIEELLEIVTKLNQNKK